MLGGTGQIGWELVRALAPLGRVMAPARADLDLEAPERTGERVRALAPRLVVNAAAYTAVDRAEQEPERVATVNTLAPGALARAAAAVGAVYVDYSTDYIFDGERVAGYAETDPPGPLNVYGRTKLAGERAIAASGAEHLIFRTSWVYGARGHNFLRTMLRLAREQDELRVVDDQHGAPTWARLIAQATAQVLAQLRAPGGFRVPPKRGGVYHLAAAGQTTWCGFAQALLAGDPRRQEQRCKSLLGIATSQYPTPARRPRHSVLRSERARREFGVTLPSWEAQLAWVLEEGASAERGTVRCWLSGRAVIFARVLPVQSALA